MFSDPSRPKHSLHPQRESSRQQIANRIIPYLGLIMIIAALIIFVAIIFAICPKMESGVWYNSGLF